MARGIGSRLIAGDHKVTLHARNIEKAGLLAAELQERSVHNRAIEVRLVGAPVEDSVVVLAVPYDAVREVIEDEYGDKLAGKILIDPTNPIDFEMMELVTPPGRSGAEEIVELLPFEASVVKAFNTTLAGTLIEGKVDGKPLDVFIAGNDARAKVVVTELVTDGDMRPFDVGPLSRAHALEAFQLVHIKLQDQLKATWMSAIKILP